MRTGEEGSKVFGIGFHKTGTTSLGLALEQLGYRVCHGARPLRAKLGDKRMMRMLEVGEHELIFAIAAGYDAFRDNPWYVLFRELDIRFPGSRFILTTRDETRWLGSALRHFGSTTSAIRTWIYGAATPLGNEDTWLERYRRHQREVLGYFSDRPEDLLIVDWERGDGWPELSRFLGRAAPAVPFPWANAGEIASKQKSGNNARSGPASLT